MWDKKKFDHKICLIQSQNSNQVNYLSGVLSKRYILDLMFDRKRNTYWHSATDLQGKVKTVSVDFNVSYF